MSIAVYLSVSVHALWAAPARTRFSGGGGGGHWDHKPPAQSSIGGRVPLPGSPSLGGGINGWRSACAPAAGEEVEDPTEDHARA